MRKPYGANLRPHELAGVTHQIVDSTLEPNFRYRSGLTTLFVIGIATASLANFLVYSTFTVSDALLALCGGLAVLRTLALPHQYPAGRAVRVSMPKTWFVFVWLIIIGGIFSSMVARDLLGSLGELAKLLASTAALPLLALTLIRHERQLVGAVLAIVGFSAAHAFAGVLGGLGLTLPFLGISVAGARQSGFTDHPNHLGLMAAIALPLAVGAQFHFGKRIGKSVALFLCAVLCIGGLLASGSVGGFVGAAAGLAIAVSAIMFTRSSGNRGRVWRQVALLWATVLLLVGFYFVNQQEVSDMFLQVGDPAARIEAVLDQGGSGSLRLQGIRTAWEEISSSPLVGRGFLHEDLVVVGTGSHRVHNLTLLTWQAGGILVVIGVLGIIALGYAVSFSATSDPSLRFVRAGLLGAITAMFVGSQSQPMLHQTYAWVPVALAFSAPILKSARAQKEQP